MVESAPDIATYEICFRGEIPLSVHERMSKAKVSRSPIETVLFKEVKAAEELDVLLEQIQSLGLPLSELREWLPSSHSAHDRR